LQEKFVVLRKPLRKLEVVLRTQKVRQISLVTRNTVTGGAGVTLRVISKKKTLSLTHSFDFDGETPSKRRDFYQLKFGFLGVILNG
jgi:hypothetical protein